MSHAVEEIQLTCKPTVGVDVLDDCCDLENYKYIEHTSICVWKSMKSFNPLNNYIFWHLVALSWTHGRSGARQNIVDNGVKFLRLLPELGGRTHLCVAWHVCGSNWSAVSTVAVSGKQNNGVGSTALIPRRGCLVHFRLPHRSGLSPPARRSPVNAARSDKKKWVFDRRNRQTSAVHLEQLNSLLSFPCSPNGLHCL